MLNAKVIFKSMTGPDNTLSTSPGMNWINKNSKFWA